MAFSWAGSWSASRGNSNRHAYCHLAIVPSLLESEESVFCVDRKSIQKGSLNPEIWIPVLAGN